jgi:hypothetical protein
VCKRLRQTPLSILLNGPFAGKAEKDGAIARRQRPEDRVIDAMASLTRASEARLTSTSWNPTA